MVVFPHWIASGSYENRDIPPVVIIFFPSSLGRGVCYANGNQNDCTHHDKQWQNIKIHIHLNIVMTHLLWLNFNRKGRKYMHFYQTMEVYGSVCVCVNEIKWWKQNRMNDREIIIENWK